MRSNQPGKSRARRGLLGADTVTTPTAAPSSLTIGDPDIPPSVLVSCPKQRGPSRKREYGSENHCRSSERSHTRPSAPFEGGLLIPAVLVIGESGKEARAFPLLALYLVEPNHPKRCVFAAGGSSHVLLVSARMVNEHNRDSMTPKCKEPQNRRPPSRRGRLVLPQTCASSFSSSGASSSSRFSFSGRSESSGGCVGFTLKSRITVTK
jgi:hypothetical protein